MSEEPLEELKEWVQDRRDRHYDLASQAGTKDRERYHQYSGDELQMVNIQINEIQEEENET